MSFAYLFERFPTFTQTFCVREVEAVRHANGNVPVFSIRTPEGEPEQDYPVGVRNDVTYLPKDIVHAMRHDPAPWPTRLRRRWAVRRHLSRPDHRRIFEALWLGPILRRRGIHHVHVHFAGMAARTAWWLKRLFGISYSFTAHANDVFIGANASSPLTLENLFSEAKGIVTVSDFSLRFLQTNYPSSAGKIRRVYNGIQPARFAGPRLPSDSPMVLAVGRYIEKKGLKYLIEACAKIPDVRLDCRIVGGGPLDAALRDLVRELGQEGRVQIVGPKSEGEIIRLLHQTRVFVLPCINDSQGDADNLPTVIMEAMAAGVPVISTPVAGVPEMVLEGKSGFLVPEHDSTLLAERLLELLLDEDLQVRLGEEGRRHCGEQFDLKMTSAQLHDFFEQCLT